MTLPTLVVGSFRHTDVGNDHHAVVSISIRHRGSSRCTKPFRMEMDQLSKRATWQCEFPDSRQVREEL